MYMYIHVEMADLDDLPASLLGHHGGCIEGEGEYDPILSAHPQRVVSSHQRADLDGHRVRSLLCSKHCKCACVIMTTPNTVHCTVCTKLTLSSTHSDKNPMPNSNTVHYLRIACMKLTVQSYRHAHAKVLIVKGRKLKFHHPPLSYMYIVRISNTV